MDTIEFIAEIAPCAVEDMMQSNVLASITVAQGILESDSGNSAPGFNLFGIKGNGAQHETKEFVNGKWITIVDGFRCYDCWADSIQDHSTFLTVNGRYALAGFFVACANLDYVAAAHALQAAGYATDPTYASNLIDIINSYKLYEYDQEAVSNLQAITDLQNDVAALKALTKGLTKTPPPGWFVTEFGAHALDGIVLDMTGDEDFWRDTAVILRIKAKGL